jgi:hypothetical protein
MCELLQVFLCEQREVKTVAGKLTDALPEGIGLNWVQQMRFKPAKNPYKAIAAAEYKYEFRESLEQEKRQRLLSLVESLIPGSTEGYNPSFGPDQEVLKPIAGRVLEIKNPQEFLNGEINHLQLVGQMDGKATLHAGKLGFFLYEMVPLERYPLIIKLNYLRSTAKGNEPVFTR